MKKFITGINNRKIILAIVCSVVMILAIMILVFEPYAEIPFVYNQF